MAVEYDEIGTWSEVKLAIIREYASAYSTILEAQRRQKIPSLKWLYIDAYAGPGLHLSKSTGDIVEGSPLIAINTNPPFSEYHFIDADPRRAKQLRRLVGDRDDVFIDSADCNDLLIQKGISARKVQRLPPGPVPARSVQYQPEMGGYRGRR